MATMNASAYRQEVEWFRSSMTKTPDSRGKPRTTYNSNTGAEWYSVRAEPGVKLYCLVKNLYLKAFQNTHATFKFTGTGDPFGVEPYSQPITATTLPFLDSYNSKNGVKGLGFEQGSPVTITLTDLNNALSGMASANFATQNVDTQRATIARVVIGLIEAARFKDVEDQIVEGTPITDRRWEGHLNASAVMIAYPG